jgi:hypothetical protein
MIVCPLCGKSSVLDTFDPSDFDQDIYIHDVYGLGRGRGFESGPWISVLGDDEVTPIIKNRVLDILKMLIDAGCLELDELFSELDM